MNITEFAKGLHGNEYGNEITEHGAEMAKYWGFVVIYGVGDLNVRFRGAINNEFCVWTGATIYFINGKIVDDEMTGYFDDETDELIEFLEKYDLIKTKKTIDAKWCDGDIPWTYKTDIPHATFDIMDGGDIFCRGIVINESHLGG